MNKLYSRILGLALCLAMLLSVLPVQAATDYPELVSREQAVAYILNTTGLKALNEQQDDLSRFSDSSLVSSEFADDLGIAVTNGILLGSNNKLNPNNAITRLEFAMVLSRTLREVPFICDIKDFSDVPAYAKGDVNKLVRSGLMNGYGEKFGVNDILTHEQLSNVLNRLKNFKGTRLQDDFYYTVNREWLNSTKLPAGHSFLMTFTELDIKNSDKIKILTSDLLKNKDSYKDGTKEQKMADFYASALDFANRDKEGIGPIKKYLQQFDGIKSIKELLDVSASFENETGINPLFSFQLAPDLMDSNKYGLYASGLSAGLPSIYFLNENPQIKALYNAFIARLFEVSGISAESSVKMAQELYAFEKIIAENTMSNVDASKVERIYNKVSVAELSKMFSKADITGYLNNLGYSSAQSVVVTDLQKMKKTGELLIDENLSSLKAFVKSRLIMSTAQYLSKDLSGAINEFNNAFLGISASSSAEEGAFNLFNGVMSGYLGKMYVEKYFSEQAKKDVEKIVADIIAAYQNRIEKLDWMSPKTKDAAIEKLKSIKVKIGYPNEWNDPLEGISIRTYSNGGSLLGNILEISAANVKYSKTLLDKPVDKNQWITSPHTVNAFYNPTNNEIIFPAGILQDPFYDFNASREKNLGGIGSIIAHEITHAFDSNGSLFDKNGNMANWWTQEDYLVFQQKCMGVINLFDGLEIAPSSIVNGALTVTENVSDLGAMACILDIMKGIPNADYKKLFETHAIIWRQTSSSQMYQLLASQDVHAPNKFRSNQIVRNFQEFHDTYNIKPGDRMYLAPENRISVW